jgi:transcriptional regulator with XRE-family HTH domain
VLDGRRRAATLATRLGTALAEERARLGMTQAACADLARMSQARWSELERGAGTRTPLETWAVAASAVGRELAAFVDRGSGAGLPRDIEHLRRQSAIAERAAGGGWTARPEAPVTTATAGRAIDLLIERPAHLEAAIIEVWNWITDVGAGLRSLDEKVEGVRRRRPGWTVTGAWVLRGTRRNRALVGELGPLFRARFPG